MTTLINHQVRLRAHPVGMPGPETWSFTTESVPAPREGEFLAKIECIAMDPAMRVWLNPGDSYVSHVRLGEVMRASVVANVIASKHPDFAVGDHVAGRLGVQEYAICTGRDMIGHPVIKIPSGSATPSAYLSVLGFPGLSAYFGLLEIGRPETGQTVVVSGATGAVGSVVGQIARIKGCRVIGIAGGAKKCAYLKEVLGFDGAVDYTTGNVAEHRGVMFTATAGMTWREMKPEDVVMAAVPLFHVSGMQRGLNGPIIFGNTIVMMTRWDAAVAAKLIERYRVTAWTGVPTMFIDLLSNPQLDHHDLSSLTSLGGGGSGMPAAVAQRMAERLKVPYVEGYGLSETLGPALINPAQRAKPQCLGIPLFNTSSLVIDPATGKEQPVGVVGEILIHGPQVFRGYWRDEAATAASFIEIDGQRFLRTGDLGYVDEDGYFFMVDRVKRMINASGFKVWPAEVEALFYHHPAIHELCVIAAADAHRGETVKALVVLKQGYSPAPTENELITWARSQMAGYKVPRQIEFVTSLPKSASGKIQWRLLQDQELAASAARIAAPCASVAGEQIQRS